MLSRVLALAIAVCTGLTGILPAGDGARCIAMDKRMAPGDDCCPKCDTPPVTAIGAACCELIHGAVLEARASSPTVEPRLAPAPLLAILSIATTEVAIDASNVQLAAQARGRPPGDLIERFTAILRI